METQECRKCGIPKDLDEFHLDKTKANGRRNICKECRGKYDNRARNTPGAPGQHRKRRTELRRNDPKAQARMRALKRLVENHSGEYSRLVTAELAQAGLKEKTWLPIDTWAGSE